MFANITYEDFARQAKPGKRTLVYKQFPADIITPMHAYHLLCKAGEPSCLLEFSDKPDNIGRHSFLGFAPYLTFEHIAGTNTLTVNGRRFIKDGNPLKILAECLSSLVFSGEDVFALFHASLIGFLSYDAVRLFEKKFLTGMQIRITSLKCCFKVIARCFCLITGWAVDDRSSCRAWK